MDQLGFGALIQYSTVQYSTIQYSTVQYSTIQYSTIQHNTVQYSTVQYSKYSTVQYSTVQYSTVQYWWTLQSSLLIATQWLLGLATWQQCKKHDEGKKGREGDQLGFGVLMCITRMSLDLMNKTELQIC